MSHMRDPEPKTCPQLMAELGSVSCTPWLSFLFLKNIFQIIFLIEVHMTCKIMLV